MACTGGSKQHNDSYWLLPQVVPQNMMMHVSNKSNELVSTARGPSVYACAVASAGVPNQYINGESSHKM
jgi:hypothetical protein